MRFLAFIVAALILMLVGLVSKAEIDFSYRRHFELDDLEITMRVWKGLWKFKMTVPMMKLVWEKGPQLDLEMQSSAQGQDHLDNIAKAQDTSDTIEQPPENSEGDSQATQSSKISARFRFARWGFFIRVFPQIPHFLAKLKKLRTTFYRGIHCTALEWKIAIGYEDPVHTALAAGTFWTLLGSSCALLYRQVTMEVVRPVLLVTPEFQKTGFSCDFHCIFKARIGHIIFAGLKLVRIFIPRRRR